MDVSNPVTKRLAKLVGIDIDAALTELKTAYGTMKLMHEIAIRLVNDIHVHNKCHTFTEVPEDEDSNSKMVREMREMGDCVSRMLCYYYGTTKGEDKLDALMREAYE